MENVIYDDRMRIYADEKDVPDWNQADNTQPTYIKNKPEFKKNYFILEDISTGYEYIVVIEDGTLASICRCERLEIVSMPNKTSYAIEDDSVDFDPTGMTICMVRQDGTTEIIDNYTIDTSEFATENSVVKIIYEEYGKTYSTFIKTECITLIDFEYIKNDDGTYTLTAWKGTYNGKPSTECIIPDSKLISL